MAGGEPMSLERPAEPAWPSAGKHRVCFLLDASSPLETRLMRDWIERGRPEGESAADCEVLHILPTRRRKRRRVLDPRLEAVLAADDDPLMTPLRVVWLAKRSGSGSGRSVRFRDVLTFGDPRDPGRLRQRLILARDPDRCRVVMGAPAPASDLRTRWREAGGNDASATTGLAEFVARQAALALERAERQLRGARYKVPRLIHEEILGRPSFRGALARLAREEGIGEAQASRRAARYLREIAAAHSPTVIDLVARLIRLFYTQGYGETLQYSREKLAGIYELAQRHPVVFLPSHKSNLDHLVLQYALHENGLPPNHTAGGINMNFFPVGQLIRRSGVFFIRRSFKDNAIYKYVLRSYVDYLIEKRFSLEWYIEGGRSRSGKLLPPRFGMLTYVVDAFRRGKSDDVFLIPVSIAYDQIQDVSSYAAEQKGGAKQRESLGWFIGVIRRMRRPYGQIHLRFGDPFSLSEQIGSARADAGASLDERSLDLQKLAFEVSDRINKVTPITPTSLVALALLGTGDRALTVAETRIALLNLVTYVVKRKLPTTVEIDHLFADEGVKRTLDALTANGVVSCYDEGPEAVYVIDADRQLAAAYYRNSIIHFFVNAGIVELALLRAGEPDVDQPVEEFWDEALRLRDLLKFEFFFAEKDAFREELRGELAFQSPDWESRLAEGGEVAQQIVQGFKPFSAHRVLRSFLEAYQVVAENLARDAGPGAGDFDEGDFLDACLSLGKQYQLQRRIRSASSVSKTLYQTALRLASNRGLLESRGETGARERQAFAEEVGSALRRVDAVAALAASRRAGLIP